MRCGQENSAAIERRRWEATLPSVWFLTALQQEALVVFGKSCSLATFFCFRKIWKVDHFFTPEYCTRLMGQFAFVLQEPARRHL